MTVWRWVFKEVTRSHLGDPDPIGWDLKRRQKDETDRTSLCEDRESSDPVDTCVLVDELLLL